MPDSLYIAATLIDEFCVCYVHLFLSLPRAICGFTLQFSPVHIFTDLCLCIIRNHRYVPEPARPQNLQAIQTEEAAILEISKLYGGGVRVERGKGR